MTAQRRAELAARKQAWNASDQDTQATR